MPPFTLKWRQLLRNCRSCSFKSAGTFCAFIPLRLPTFHLLFHLAIHWYDALNFRRFYVPATSRAFSCRSQLRTHLPSERSSKYSNTATSRSLLAIQSPIMKYHHQALLKNSYLYVSFFSFAFHDILLPADHILYYYANHHILSLIVHLVR